MLICKLVDVFRYWNNIHQVRTLFRYWNNIHQVRTMFRYWNNIHQVRTMFRKLNNLKFTPLIHCSTIRVALRPAP
jgi:hypothetical protein